MSKGKIIVTGGLGFIGSNLICRLNAQCDDEIVVVDDFGTDDKWKNIAKRTNVSEYIPIANALQYINAHADETRCIIHLGAISATTERDVDALIANNYNFSTDIYQACKANAIPLIYASSASVYGNMNQFDDSTDIAALEKLRPLNAYGWSKKLFDVYVSRDHGFDNEGSQVVGLRFFNVYGPNEYHKGSQASVMYHFYDQVLQRGVINLFASSHSSIADGQQSRDFVYVDDCVDVIIWMMNHQTVNGIYNVGTGASRTYNALSLAIFDELGCRPNINYIPMPKELASQYQNYTKANLKRLRAAGYTRQMMQIEDGIKHYYKILKSEDQYI